MRTLTLQTIGLIAFVFSHVIPSATAQELPRTLVALVPSSMYSNDYEHPLRRNVEFVLNHLGLQVRYLDVDQPSPLPSPAELAKDPDVLGLITYFENENSSFTPALIPWLEQLAHTRLPWIALGQFGFLDSPDQKAVIHLLENFGIERTSPSGPAFLTQVRYQSPGFYPFEKKLGPPFRQYPPLAATAKNHQKLLELSAQNQKRASTVASLSPRMSYAYGEFGLSIEPGTHRRQWSIDPFQFFEKALHLPEKKPIPDVNVLNGTRVYFAHIDGDGFTNLSNSPNPGDHPLTCAEVVQQEILAHYSMLPFGVSVILNEVLPKKSGPSPALIEAQKILSLSNIEPASHTQYHPLTWWNSPKANSSPTFSYERYGFNTPTETSETVGSVELLNQQVLKKQTARSLLYWSGNCLPSENALRLAREGNVLAMNGGDSRMDATLPSLAYLSPLGRSVGKEFQVFSGAANDNIYIDGGAQPFFRFRALIDYHTRTGSPRILKPMNPYFHFFTADQRRNMKVIREIIDQALTQEIAPVFPSTYIQSAYAFRASQIAQKTASHYELKNIKNLHTLRWDHPERVGIHWSKSKGIIGLRRWKNSLYAFLNPNEETAEVELTSGKDIMPNHPTLHSLGGLVESWQLEKNKLTIRIGSFARGPLRLHSGAFPPEKLKIKIDQKTIPAKTTADQLAEIPLSTSLSPQLVEVEW